MGCKCRERRKSLSIVRKNAKLYAEISNEEIQIYSYLENKEIMYNFEPINKERENIIEYIKP